MATAVASNEGVVETSAVLCVLARRSALRAPASGEEPAVRCAAAACRSSAAVVSATLRDEGGVLAFATLAPLGPELDVATRNGLVAQRLRSPPRAAPRRSHVFKIFPWVLLVARERERERERESPLKLKRASVASVCLFLWATRRFFFLNGRSSLGRVDQAPLDIVDGCDHAFFFGDLGYGCPHPEAAALVADRDWSELASADFAKGVDPKSGRAYYVDNRTRETTWVIDGARVDVWLGRLFVPA